MTLIGGTDYKFDNYGNLLVDSIEDLIYERIQENIQNIIDDNKSIKSEIDSQEEVDDFSSKLFFQFFKEEEKDKTENLSFTTANSTSEGQKFSDISKNISTPLLEQSECCNLRKPKNTSSFINQFEEVSSNDSADNINQIQRNNKMNITQQNKNQKNINAIIKTKLSEEQNLNIRTIRNQENFKNKNIKNTKNLETMENIPNLDNILNIQQQNLQNSQDIKIPENYQYFQNIPNSPQNMMHQKENHQGQNTNINFINA